MQPGNRKLCTTRVVRRGPQQQPEQLQSARKGCSRRHQPCHDRVSVVEEGKSDENTAKESAVKSEKLVQISVSMDAELPTISATDTAPMKKKRRRAKRGYRIFYRPVSSASNYYSVPFPAPETLRLECDGDEAVWQDVEVRVISHAGLVVWHDIQTDEETKPAPSGPTIRRPSRRKFTNQQDPRRPQPPPPSPPPQLPASGRQMPRIPRHRPQLPLPPQSQTLQSAMLSIEATIQHGLLGLLPPPPLCPAARPQSQARPPTTKQLIGATVSHSNATAGRSSRRPMYLMRQLERIQQVKIKEIEQAQAQAQSQERAQRLAQVSRQPPPVRRTQMQQPTKSMRHKQGGVKHQLPSELTRQSKIPQLMSSWYHQRQPQRSSASCEPPEEEIQRLRRKLLQKLRTFHRHGNADDALNEQVCCGCREHLPSYMRPYSPVLHYPTPTQLPVPAARGAKRTGGSSRGPSNNSTVADAPDTWGIN